jgi:hypothetical protein
MSEDGPSEYQSQTGVPLIAKLGLVLASLAITAAVLVIAIAE